MAFPSLSLRDSSILEGTSVKPIKPQHDDYPETNSIYKLMKAHKLTVCTLILVCYLVIGALGFRYAEKEYDEKIFENYKKFLENITEMDNLSGHEVLHFMNDAIKAYDDGFDLRHMIDSYHNHTTYKERKRWQFAGSFLFSTTVITTIGYGHLCPGTLAGRVFCVIYAFIGIPLCLLAARLIGESYMVMHKAIIRHFGARALCRRLLHIVVFLSGISFFFIAPAALFIYTEEWSYWNALYASFIALTTIGFGDYVPGCYGEDHDVYKIFLSIWIYTGLAFFGLIMTMIEEMAVWLGRRFENTSESNSKEKKANFSQAWD